MKREPGLAVISPLLTRVVTESERASVASYRSMPPHILQELKDVRMRCGRLGAMKYIQFFVDRNNDDEVPDFIVEVVESLEIDPSAWRINDIVFVSNVSFLGSVVDYRKNVEELEGERWYRVEKIRRTLDSLENDAPGVLVRNFKAGTQVPWRQIPEPCGVSSIKSQVRQDGDALIKIEESGFALAVRRWQAKKIANFAFRNPLQVNKGLELETLLAILTTYEWPVSRGGEWVGNITNIEPSADALIAINALVKESQLPDADFPNSAGFLGPDDWYR